MKQNYRVVFTTRVGETRWGTYASERPVQEGDESGSFEHVDQIVSPPDVLADTPGELQGTEEPHRATTRRHESSG